MTSAALQPHDPRRHGAVALLRRLLGWLLVAVLAIDLVSSPLHAHRHDGEWSAGANLVASASHAGELLDSVALPLHAEPHEALAISHSISALRSVAEIVAAAPASEEPGIAVPGWVPAPGSPERAAACVWPPDRQRAGSSAFKSLPPQGRAPPPLHA